MSSYFLMIFSILLFSLFSNPILARNAGKPFRARALVLPVTRDASTRQYITTIYQRTPLRAVNVALDIGGKGLWVACDSKEYRSSTYKPALCHSPTCKLAKSTSCGNCWDGPRPGCNVNTCNEAIFNTVSKTGWYGQLGTDVLGLNTTSGSNPGPVVPARNFPFTCGSLSLGGKLAKGVKGIAGFGNSDTSLPSLLSFSYKTSRKFAICLSSSKGVAFVGDGPFTMLPGMTVSSPLVYAPLLVNPVATAEPVMQQFPDKSRPSTEYYVRVSAITVGGVNVAVSPINKSGGGGTKISTVVPYTVLQTSIYEAVTKAFRDAVPKKLVRAVAPFGTCYKASGFMSTRVGPDVPSVTFVFGRKGQWSVFGANVMVYMGNDVACLGFVDGGKKAKTASVVIGGYQLEDHFVEFDVEKSRVGFGSTLRGMRTSCSNFNFTIKP